MTHAALLSSVLAAGLVAGGPPSPAGDDLPPPGDGPTVAGEHVIELALCLDTSGSMDGLLHSARQKLWTIVNDLAAAEPTPRLRVALLSYGNDAHDPEQGWVAVETPFTEDLDTVSQRLFALTTGGGTELVGRVVQTSLRELDWHSSADALRMVFVAGNEAADQDEELTARALCEEAEERGVDVNAIYCVHGDDDSEVVSGWRELARRGHGAFATIDQDDGSVVIATAHDEALVRLSGELNATYVPFGDAGQAGCTNQAAQDANAARLNLASAASRAATKAGKLYACGAWDLVDATRDGQVDLATLDEADLPEDMRALTLAQREEHLASMGRRRAELQGWIRELDGRRQALLTRELARQARTSAGGFDLAVRRALRSRAEARGFTFAPPEVTATIVSPPLELAEASGYFVQLGGPGNDLWVADDLAGTYEDARRRGAGFDHDVHVVPGTPEAEAFLGSLPGPVRELVRSLQGMIYLRWDGRVHLVTGGC